MTETKYILMVRGQARGTRFPTSVHRQDPLAIFIVYSNIWALREHQVQPQEAAAGRCGALVLEADVCYLKYVRHDWLVQRFRKLRGPLSRHIVGLLGFLARASLP